VVGGALTLSTANALGQALDTRQAYLLTAGIWLLVPFFGAIPFYIGAPGLSLNNAYFEAVSGITTTGATVIVGLDDLPAGMNLWRGMLNWLGGLGIAFIAMIFLPLMRVGGMQFFRTEGFDTFGKALPRATDIASQLLIVYLALTVLTITVYAIIGMEALDAVVNGFATVSTGGFSPSDISFSKYAGAGEYFGALFMVLAALPYIRFVQLMNGAARPLVTDIQIRSYILWLMAAVAMVTVWRMWSAGSAVEPAFRETLFNLTSIMTGTGFFSGSFVGWRVCDAGGLRRGADRGVFGVKLGGADGVPRAGRAAVSGARNSPDRQPEHGRPGEIRWSDGGRGRAECGGDVRFGLYRDHRASEHGDDADRG
jgi:trk system potassium uptake protein